MATVAPETSQVVIPGLSPKQVQRLLSLIHVPNGGYEKLSGNVSWLIDSRASSHMTCRLENLNEVTTICPIPISLPNGTHTLSRKKGTVTLKKGDTLQEVLYGPELNCNLLSVAKLCRDLKCTVTFSDKSCVLQDRTSRSPIRVGEQRDGVYYYSGTP